MQVWARRAVPFPSALLRQGARKLTEDSSRRRAIAEESGNNRGRFFCKNRRIDNTLLVLVEETTGLRRRWIAWPRDRNRDDPYEANAPLLHISHYLPPVMAEAVSCLDVKSSFIVSLPRETRHLFRCRVEDGTLVELTRHPMGYKAGPEILQMVITSAIAGVTTVVHRLWAAPPSVRVDVWIDNIRIAGSKSDATLWEAQVLRNADSCHATIGEEREPGATQCTFLGVRVDHTHRAVSLIDKFVRSVCVMPAVNSLTIAEMEVVASRFCMRPQFWARVYVSTAFSSRQCDDDYPHLTGGLCRRHPRR
ncbi:target of rapamycin (TOR) kinase 1, putative, partial [Trypanosoma cruzi]